MIAKTDVAVLAVADGLLDKRPAWHRLGSTCGRTARVGIYSLPR